MNFGNLHSCVARVPAWTRVLTQVHRLDLSASACRAGPVRGGGRQGRVRGGGWAGEDGRGVNWAPWNVRPVMTATVRLGMWARDGIPMMGSSGEDGNGGGKQGAVGVPGCLDWEEWVWVSGRVGFMQCSFGR